MHLFSVATSEQSDKHSLSILNTSCRHSTSQKEWLHKCAGLGKCFINLTIINSVKSVIVRAKYIANLISQTLLLLLSMMRIMIMNCL